MSDSRRQISKYIAVFAGGTMISRITGLIRDCVMLAIIPTAPLAAFNLAFRLPNMLRDLVGEGASNAAFVPVLAETLDKEGKEAFKDLTSALFSAVLLVLGIITILGVLFMPYIYTLLEPLSYFTKETEKLSPHYMDLLVPLTQWTFPYIFFIGLTVFQMGPLFVMKHYGTPSWSPSLLNIAQVAVCSLLLCFPNAFSDPAYALVIGVWIGGIAQFAVQYLAVGKYVGSWKPNFRLRHPGVKKAFWLWLPVIAGQSAGEINKFIDFLFAGSMGPDAFNALFYSNRIVQLPLAIFGIAISTAILPSISRSAARDEMHEVHTTLLNGLQQSFFLICPAMIAIQVLPQPIIAVLFQRGYFTAHHTEMTAAAMMYLAAGLLSFSWVKIAVAGFYAVQDTKTPVTTAFISVILNICFIFLLSRPMGYCGLALATTLSYSANFLMLYFLLSRRFGLLWNREFGLSLAKIFLAAGIMALAILAVHHAFRAWRPETGFIPALCDLLLSFGIGGLIYLGACAFFRVRDFYEFFAVFRGRVH